MGWTVISNVKRPNVAYIGTLFEQDTADLKISFVDGSIVKLKEFYGVVDYFIKKTGETKRVPVVALISMYRDHSFGIKELSLSDMDKCPQKILDLLHKGVTKDIDDWIDGCTLRIAARLALPKVGKGSEFDFSPPIRLMGGVEVSSAKVDEIRGQRLIMHGPGLCPTRFRISVPSLKNMLQKGSAVPVSALQSEFEEESSRPKRAP